MSDSTTTGMDPRFDPRFQRGYTDAAADTRPTSPASKPQRVPFSPPPEFDATARLLEALERTAPSRLIQPPASVAGGAAPDEADDATSSGIADDAALGPAPEPEPEPGDRHERVWFIAGWAFSAALLALGMWWVWAVNSDPDYYTGMGAADMTFRQLGWSLAPPFMQIGALGVVLVTAFAAARQLDRSRVERRTAGADPAAGDRGFWRTPGVVALIVIVAASAVIVIWLVRQITEGSVYGFGPEPTDEEVTRMALTQFASSAIGPVALAAIGAMLGIILLGACDARRVSDRVSDNDDVSEPPGR